MCRNHSHSPSPPATHYDHHKGQLTIQTMSRLYSLSHATRGFMPKYAKRNTVSLVWTGKWSIFALWLGLRVKFTPRSVITGLIFFTFPRESYCGNYRTPSKPYPRKALKANPKTRAATFAFSEEPSIEAVIRPCFISYWLSEISVFHVLQMVLPWKGLVKGMIPYLTDWQRVYNWYQ